MKESLSHLYNKQRTMFHPQRKVSFNKYMNEDIRKEEKNNILSKADLDVQKMLSSLLYTIAEEDKSNLDIKEKLKQIDLNKKVIAKKNYDSSADSSSSDGTQLVSNKQRKSSSKSVVCNSIKNKLLQGVSPKNNQRMLIQRINSSKRYSSVKDNINQLNANKISSLMHQNEKYGVISLIQCDKESLSELNLLRTDIYNNINLKPKSYLKDKELSFADSVVREMREDQIEKGNEYYKRRLSNINILNQNDKEQMRRIFKYHKPVYDSLSDEEEDIDEMNINYYYIDPKCPFKYIVDFLVVFALFASFIYLPYTIAFKWDYYHSQWDYYLNCSIDSLFICDIFICLFTGYYDEDDQIVKDFNKIILNYLKGWFWLDFIFGFPYCTIIDTYIYLKPKSFFATATYSLYTNDLLLLLHIIKFLRFFKAIKAFYSNSFIKFLMDNYFQDIEKTKWTILYLSLVLYSAFINLLACIFVFLGCHTYPNWIEFNGLTPQYKAEIYVTSIYFMITTSFAIGYGDISLKNHTERVFNVILLVFGLVSHSWVVTALSSNFEFKETQVKIYDDKMRILEQIRLSHKGFVDKIDDKIKRYLNYNLEKDQSNPSGILEILPYKLRTEVVFDMYKHILNDFVFFKNFKDNEFKFKVVLALKPIEVLKNELILSKGDFIEEMIFVKKGILALEIPFPSLLSEQIYKTKSMAMLIKRVNSKNVNPRKSSLFANFPSYKKFASSLLEKQKEIEKEKENEQKKLNQEFHNVKLIEIRQNEHFGDVIMFLNQRCPLQVKVQSKTAELFLLRQVDALDISISFPKIWKKIITKSVYNWKQINLLIRKTLQLFMKNNAIYQNILETEIENIIQNADQIEIDDIEKIINENDNENNPNQNVKDLITSSPFASFKNTFWSKVKKNKSDMPVSNREEDNNTVNASCNMSLCDSANIHLITGDKVMNNSIISSNSNDKTSNINLNKYKSDKQPMRFFKDHHKDSNNNKKISHTVLENKYNSDKALDFNFSNSKLSLTGSPTAKIINTRSPFRRKEINQELLPGEDMMSSLYLQRRNSYSNIKKFVYLCKCKSESQFSILSSNNSKNKNLTKDKTQYTLVISSLKENKETNEKSIVYSNRNSNLILSPILTRRNMKDMLSEYNKQNKMLYSNDDLLLSYRTNKINKEHLKNSLTFKTKTLIHPMKPGNILLDQIEQNIEQNAINLNQPSLFYINIFQNMIEQEKAKQGNFFQLCKKLKRISKMIKDND